MTTSWIDLPADLGKVSPMNARDVAEWVAGHTRNTAHPPALIANLNLHALYMREVDQQYRQFLDKAGRILIDGWPVLLLARSGRRSVPVDATHRVGSTDWLDELLEIDPKLRVVAVGGTPATAEKTKQAVSARTSNLCWTAVDGFSGASADTNADLGEALRTADVVLVGMGMPLQERWIIENWARLGGAIVANVGGCLDYYAGAQRLAPRWMGRWGLEWVFRLVNDPRRLAGRYLLEPLLLAVMLTRRTLIPERSTSAAGLSK